MAPQREWFEKDYYKVLGVSETAHRRRRSPRRTASWPASTTPTPTPATRRPRSASRRSRPPTTSSATRSKRKEYDEVRRLGPDGRRLRRRSGGGPGRRRLHVHMGDGGDLGDLLGGLFGRGRGGAAAARPVGGVGPAARRRPRGRAAPARSTTPSQGVTTIAPPHERRGVLARATARAPSPGTHAARLPGVRRPRRARRQPGLLLVQPRRARTAAGAGVVIDDPCPTCRGTGVERRPREVKVRIPAGVDDGQRIRLKGRGGPGPQRRPAGRPLRRPCSVAAAPAVRPRGRRPHAARARHLPEAALGADVEVPTLDGGPVTLKLQPGTQPRLEAPGEGPGRRRPSKRTGDLLVTVEVAVPRKLDATPSARRSRRWRRPIDDVAPRPPGGVMADGSSSTAGPST